MATVTAQILIGSTHPSHGGVSPTHALFLSENSRPAWALVELDVSVEHPSPVGRVVWIPTVECMLEDAMLMIAVHICEDPQIVQMATAYCGDARSDGLELYECFSEAQRRELYNRCRGLRAFPKVVVTVLDHSTIRQQIQVIGDYAMDAEVCCSSYVREYSGWRGETVVRGSLE